MTDVGITDDDIQALIVLAFLHRDPLTAAVAGIALGTASLAAHALVDALAASAPGCKWATHVARMPKQEAARLYCIEMLADLRDGLEKRKAN